MLDFIASLCTLFASEVLDKTWFIALLLVQAGNGALATLGGAAAAFLVTHGVSGALGASAAAVAPRAVTLVSVASQLYFGGVFLQAALRGESEERPVVKRGHGRRRVALAFMQVLTAEMGDRSQVTGFSMAASHADHKLEVWLGGLLGLWLCISSACAAGVLVSAASVTPRVELGFRLLAAACLFGSAVDSLR